MLKSVFLFLIGTLNVFSGTIQKGHTLTATVTTENNEPAIGLNVVIEDTQLGAFSDLDGNFTISNIEHETCIIILTGVGFETKKVSIDFKGKTLLKLNLKVNLSSESLSEVHVNGISSTQKIQKQGFAVDIIKTKDFLNETGGLNQILATTPGVIVRESGGLGSNFNLSLNGLSGNQIRYYFDGIPMEDFGSALSLNNFSANLIENMEIYKGVVPIHLSSDALGGAINITTPNPRKELLDVSYSIGSFNTQRTSIFAQKVSDKGVFFKVSSFLNHSDNNYWVHDAPKTDELGNVIGKMNVRRFHDKYTSGMGSLKIGVIDKKFADELSLNATFATNKNQIQHPDISINEVYGGLHTKNKTALGSVVYKKELKSLKIKAYGLYGLSKETVIDTLSRNYNWNKEYTITNNTGEFYSQKSIFEIKDKMHRNAISLTNKFNDQHRISTNFSMNYLKRVGNDELNPNNLAYKYPNWVNKKNLGFSYEYESMNKDFHLNTFIKNYWYNAEINAEEYVDNQYQNVTTSVTFNSFGYGLANSYHFSKNLSSKLSYERAYRLPEANEILGNGLLIVANPDLREEQSDNINLGLGFDNHITDNAFKVSTNLFYRYSKGFIRPISTGILTKYVNEENVRTIGIEGSTSFQFKKKYSIALNATYQNITDQTKFDEGLENVNYQYRVPNIPYLFGNLRTGMNIAQKNRENNLNLSWNAQYIHKFFLYWEHLGSAENKNVIPSQFINDVIVDYSMINGKYNISLTAKNIFDIRAYDNFNIEKPGRSFYIKLRYFLQ